MTKYRSLKNPIKNLKIIKLNELLMVRRILNEYEFQKMEIHKI